MKSLCCVVGILALCGAMARSARAQAQVTTGVIQGTVEDPSGALVPGARVEAKNLDTSFTRSQSTDGDGRFVFLAMPTGRYTVTVSKEGFARLVQENVTVTVGETITLRLPLKVSTVAETVTVTSTPMVDSVKTEASTTLNQLTVATTPILGRKFEDLLTLTPGVSIVQGPDGDEINFNGQRGIFNNISLDGGDYNNGFFGEQLGGQRAAIDITLDAVKEFQVVASGASAEFGRTAGGVVNVITKSGTNEVHGTAFHFQRLEALASNTSDGKPLKDFSREQFGGTVGGPIVKGKMFYFGAYEQILAELTRGNLSAPIGPACPVSSPNEAQINASAECQRVALIGFFKSKLNQDEGSPIQHPIRNSAALGRFDWLATPANQFSASYNFDYSKNTNQTFDVPTYGNSANGIEGPSHIHAVNFNWITTVSSTKLNEAHFTYQRELRPRAATPSSVPADTAMGFATTFRFGSPFFLNPKIDETIWRTQARDNFSIVSGKHTLKFGGEWIHTLNSQTFRGFFTGRYIFDSVVGFLRYASPAAPKGFGPNTVACSDGTFVTAPPPPPPPPPFNPCASPTSTAKPPPTPTGGPLLFFLQDGVPTGLINIPPGASSIKNEDYALFAQDKWQIRPSLTLNYGLRWEGQILPDVITAPSKTAYGFALGNPNFPSDGTLHSQKTEFQPRVGFAWDVRNNRKSLLRANWGIYNARQNMLTQVGSITTNGVQQRTIFSSTSLRTAFGAPTPTWPGAFPVTPSNPPCDFATPPNPFPCFTGVRVFSKDYANPRIYTTNFSYEQEIAPGWAAYLDVTLSKGVHMTRFLNINNGSGPTPCCAISNNVQVPIPGTGDAVFYQNPGVFGPFLGDVFLATSRGKSLYRGGTVGVRKRFSNRFQMEANYALSEDLDDDSNERDPFSDRSFNRFDLAKDYALSDRDEKHKFNFFTYAELPWGFTADARIQAHSAQPITDNPGSGTGAPCSPENSNFRVVNGVDCGRNHLRKDNAFFSFDWRLTRPFKFRERVSLIPTLEMFNTFNNKNNLNPLSTPGLFDFNGFLRQGVGDPRQAELALKVTF